MVQLITPAPSEPPLPLLGDSALLDHLRRDTVALGAAQSRMDAYCLELLRASCIASGIGDPRTDISDLLTIKIQESAIHAGLWMKAAKAIVLDSLGQRDSEIRRHFSEAPYVASLVAEEKAKEFFRGEPEGEHVAQLTILLTFIGFPPPPTVGDAIVKAFSEIDAARQVDEQRALALKEQETQELAIPQKKGSKTAVAAVLAVCVAGTLQAWGVMFAIYLAAWFGDLYFEHYG